MSPVISMHTVIPCFQEYPLYKKQPTKFPFLDIDYIRNRVAGRVQRQRKWLCYTWKRIICDWILESRSKSHIRSFEINGFEDLKPLQLAKVSKHEYEIYTKDASIYHLSDNLKYFWLLLKFPPNKIENLTCCTSFASITSAHKGVGGGGGR